MRVYWYNSLVLLGLFQALLALSGAVFTFASTKSLWDHPAFKKKAIETTQKLMLSALGLTEFPRPGPEMVPHDYMVELYDRLSRGEHQGSDTEQVKTVRAYADQGRLLSLLSVLLLSVCDCLCLFSGRFGDSVSRAIFAA